MRSVHMPANIMRISAAVLGPAGFLSSLYYAFDLAYPNHFVGDMYGLEVLFRGAVLALVLAAWIGGLSMMAIGRKRGERWTVTGILLIDIASGILIWMAIGVHSGRQQDAFRKTYPQKSTDALITIALDRQDPFALYEITARKDQAAVPKLSEILLDKTQNERLRLESAHALGQIGGTQARAALEKAMTMPGGNPYLTETIRRGMETIDRANENPRPTD